MTTSPTFIGFSAGSLTTEGVLATGNYSFSVGLTQEIPNYITFTGASATVGSSVSLTYGTKTAQVTYEGYYRSGGVEYPLLFDTREYILPNNHSLPLGSGNETDPITFASYDQSACYLQGTIIETDSGPVPVEMLNVGDRVVSAFGGTSPVRWIGHTRVNAARHPRPWDVNPVLIRAGAFGELLPRRDLRLSPDHAVYVDGVLIPIRHLINEATIVQEPAGRITYWHVELGLHDVILAEGLPAESYLDTGNRAAFDNASVTALRPEFQLRDRAAWDALACAALHETGPVVETIRARLNARARELGWALAIGFQVRVNRLGAMDVSIPAGIGRVHLLSGCRAGADDGRRLGAAISSVALDGVPSTLSGAMLASGFHAVERSGVESWRWTNGMGVLRFPASDRACLLTIGVAMLSGGDIAIAA